VRRRGLGMPAEYKPYKLSREREREIKRIRRAIHDALPEFDRLESCGIDCQENRQGLMEEAERLGKILEVFGSGSNVP